MRGQGRVRIVALNRLFSGDTIIWVSLRDVASNVVSASSETRIFPTSLCGVSVAQVGLVLRRCRIVMYSVGVEWVRLVFSALGTVQDTSTDSGGTWPSTNSDRVIVCFRIGGSANIRHAICFPGRREFDRVLVVGIRVAVASNAMATRAICVVIVKVGIVRSGSGFRSGKCNILVKLLCTPTADYCRDKEDQNSESDKSNRAKCTSNSSSVVKESLVAIGIHDGS